MNHQIIIFFCCLSTNLLFGQGAIERVEPPNWWIGMKHNKIQLLVYGKQIANLEPVINNKNITLKKVNTVENPNYLFLDIEIHATENKTISVPIHFQQAGKTKLTYKYQLLKRTESSQSIDGFNSSDAIYLITPDRFANGKKSNDNIKGYAEKIDRKNIGGRHGGDIEGMRKHLDYIKDLGFTAIWLNPLLENNMKEYSYHGYSTTDFYKVDPRYGSNKSYQKLATEARSKGIKLIMDMIVNHCGLYHWWMEDLPEANWINQWETYTETNHRKTLLQDPYAAESDKKQFTDGWFVPTMPDLNQRNPFMAKYLIQNSIWWVEYLSLSGIRMDTYPYPDMYFMSDWTKEMMIEYPNLNIVGEEWAGSPSIVSYWQKGKNNPNGYESWLKSVMDFPVQVELVDALNHKESFGTGWIELYEMIAHDFLYPDPQNLVVFPDNHDMSRIFTQINEDYNKFKQAIAFTLTTRGVPQLYYGTEILMKNPGTVDHGVIRSDFPGGWKKDKINAMSGKGLTEQQKSAQIFIKQLLQWRKTATAVHTGRLTHFLPKDGMYVYFRYNDSQQVMVILNKNETNTTLDLKRFDEILKGKTTGKDIITSKNYTLTNSIEVPANAALILELK